MQRKGPGRFQGFRFASVTMACFLLATVLVACSGKTILTTRIAPANDQRADLVILNGKVWTAVDADGERSGPRLTAIAVIGDRISFVGDEASVGARTGPNTKIIDADGRRVIPGITDCHTHLISGGLQLARLTLRDVRSRGEFVRAVAREAAKKRSEWILGGRWSVESWTDPYSPNKSWIDSVTRDTPVFLSRMDGHSALVNSAALRLAGIDRNGPRNPPGGEIERNPQTREPTGILKESAMALVRDLIPRPSAQDQHEALLRAMRHANSLGITAVHDMSELRDLAAFRSAEKSGELTLRITTYLSVSDWGLYADKMHQFGLNSEMLRLVGFKGYMDGSLGSRTAYMRYAYSDATREMPYPRGQLTVMADPPEEFDQLVALADSRGLQVAVHAIGDEANHLLVNAYEYALKRNRQKDARHRIEHAQHLYLSDIDRIAVLGIVASMQPYHKADDGRYAEKAIGTERLAGSYAFRRLVDAGALVVFGSDWPVVTMNPFAGVDSAVNARTLAGDVWLPTHSLTVEESLRAYTVSAARAVHREDRRGTIEVGKYADIVILSDDPFTMPKEDVGKIEADITIVGGTVVFER